VRPLALIDQRGLQPYTDLAFSKDGQILAAVGCDQALRLWEVSSGRELPAEPEAGSGTCAGGWKVAFSPAGNLLATTASAVIDQAAWNVVQLWIYSKQNGAQALHSLPASRKPVTSLAFSPDGRLLAGGTTENSLILWFIPEPGQPRTTTVTELGALPHGDWVVDATFSPDGRALAAATAELSGGRFAPMVKIWDVQSLLTQGIDEATVLQTLEAPSGPLRRLAYNPDGQLLAAAGGGVTLWEAADGELLAFLEAPAELLAFSPDGRTMAAAGPDLLLLWDVQAGLQAGRAGEQEWASLEGVAGEIHSLAFAPDGRALGIISEAGALELWGVQP
jgi:WD40 repeat protein